LNTQLTFAIISEF